MLLKEDLFLIGAVLWAVGIVAAWILKKAPRKILFWSVVYFYVIGVLAVTLFPFIIENLQLIVGCIVGLNYRSFDVDDFILNTIGVYMGYILGKLILRPYREKIRTRIF